MTKNKDVYTKAIESLKKTQDALLNEISIADGRSRVHAPTFFYVSAAINQIKDLQKEAQPKVVEAKTEDKPVVKTAAKK